MKNGYSFLEVIVYTGILALIFALSVGSILSVHGGFNKTMIESRISRNGEFALERMVRDMRMASSTNTTLSVFGESPGVLQLGTNPIKYFLSSTTLQRKDEGNQAENITSSDVRVVSLLFFRDSISSPKISSEIIKVEFELEAGSGKFFKSRKFFGSAVLRGAY